mgnify:CR=1 FL=1
MMAIFVLDIATVIIGNKYCQRYSVTSEKFDYQSGDDRIHFLNTENSDAIVIESNGKFAMIDAGEGNNNPRRDTEYKGYETEVVEYKFKEEAEPFTLVLCEDGVYNVVGPMIKKLFDKTDFNNDPSIRRFAKQIRDLGVDAALREKGVQNGDTVRILDYEFEFFD